MPAADMRECEGLNARGDDGAGIKRSALPRRALLPVTPSCTEKVRHATAERNGVTVTDNCAKPASIELNAPIEPVCYGVFRM